MGSEDKVEQSFERPFRRENDRSKQTCELTSSLVPRGTLFHRLVELEFPPIALDPERPHAAAASLVHLNSVPSVQMRCIMTAKRRASATIAFFIPRCLAIFIAQALSQDHFAERNSMTGRLHRALSASSRPRSARWRQGDRARQIGP